MINRAVLTGRLTKDVELRKSPSGVSVTSFTLACDRNTKEKEADFISCVAWRNTAEFLSKYTHKGDKIALEGRIQTRTYDDSKGKKVYVTEVIVDSVDLCSSKKSETVAEEREYSFTDAVINVSSDDLPF